MATFDERWSALDELGAGLDRYEPTQELRAYTPTWRERIGAWLMGDGGGQPKRDLVAGMVGSTGLPNTARRDTAGLSLADILPVIGGTLGANDALREGDDPRAAANAVTAVAPLAAPLVRGAVAAAPRATAATAGLLGAGMTPADAGPRLTREQRQQIEVERQRLEAQRQAEEAAARMRAQTDMERMQAEAEFQRQRAAQDAELQRQMEAQRQRDAEAAAARARDAEARMPFRERYPNLAAALPFAGGAAAFLAPAIVKAGKTAFNNRAIKQWEEAVDAAREVLPGATKAQAKSVGAEMRSFADRGERMSNQPGWGVMGASATLPAEASLLPQEYDALMLPKGDPNREAAWATLTDPAEMAKRAATGVMAGIPLAKLGSELPVWRSRPAPAAQTIGIIELADQQSAARARPKPKSKPKSKPKAGSAPADE